MEIGLAFAVGLMAGMILVFLFDHLNRNSAKQAFSALSREALSQNSDEFLKLANATLSTQTQTGIIELDGKKKLIDHTLLTMNGELEKIEKIITDFDLRREKAFGEVSTQLTNTAEQTRRLQAILTNTKSRGQWGERMAEDILRLSGFVEGVNYQKQKTQETVTSRPDFTFLLPQERVLHMDVKFPRDNYIKYVNEENETARENYKQQFLRDTRQRIKEVLTRDYINPQEKTLDYVLVFVPSEQIYAFINENDGSVMDDSLKNKVVLCSPLTLYAILAVIRQAIDNFHLSSTTTRITELFADFSKQWQAFKDGMDKMGKRINEASTEFQNLNNTRTYKLDAAFKRIEDFRARQVTVDRGTEPSSISAEH
jgi:DNA recombination protein RmuC